jgi:hypothetical protein
MFDERKVLRNPKIKHLACTQTVSGHCKGRHSKYETQTNKITIKHNSIYDNRHFKTDQIRERSISP